MPAGACVGPVFPGFQYNSDAGTQAAQVSWSLNRPVVSYTADVMQHSKSQDSQTSGHPVQFHCYFKGGGCFVDPPFSADPSSSSYEVLGHYSDVDLHPTAVVKCYVGKGLAVLSGVHLEFDPDLLNADSPHLHPLLPSLRSSDTHRQTCLRQVLQLLGIQVTVLQVV